MGRDRHVGQAVLQMLPALCLLSLGCTSREGELSCTLQITEGVVNLPFGVRLTTRLYNGSFPGPVLTAAPGDRVRLLIQNRLLSLSFSLDTPVR